MKSVRAIGALHSQILPTGLIRRLATVFIGMAVAGLSAAAVAYETDQFSNRDVPIADSTELLNVDRKSVV